MEILPPHKDDYAPDIEILAMQALKLVVFSPPFPPRDDPRHKDFFFSLEDLPMFPHSR